MKSALVRLWKNLTVRDKGTIRQRIRKMFFLLSITTLIFSSVLALVGIVTTSDKMGAMGEQLGDSTRDSVTELMLEQEKRHLERIVHEKVGIMNALLKGVAKNTEIISRTTAEILSEPQNYLPQELIHPQSIKDGWALSLMLTPSSIDNLENLRGKIALAANNQLVLKGTALSALSYGITCSVYTVFEEGYGLSVDTSEADMRWGYFDNPNEYFEFNFIERPWYKNAKEKNSLVFNDNLNNVNELNTDPIVVCSLPINVNGEFVGVGGIGLFVKDIGRVALNTEIKKTGYCFIMNNDGQVIVSPRESGDLSVKSDFPDLRDSSEQSLAEAAEKIANGEQGSMFVTVDGSKYYLAFEPLKNVDWSFGALIKVEEITAPADYVAMFLDEQMDEYIKKTGRFSFKLFLLMAVLYILLLVAVSVLSERFTKYFSKPIHRLSEGVRDISSGNFDRKIDDIKTGDELEHLATCFNAMTDKLTWRI